MFGYDQAFIGGTLSLPAFQQKFGLTAATTTQLSSNITAIFQGGCFFGAIAGYPVAEVFGRKLQLICSGIVCVIGVILQVVSNGSVGMMYAGRFITGFSVGTSSLVVPIYIAESAPATIRGRLVGIFECVLQIAGIFGFWVNYGIQQNLPVSDRQWEIPFAVQLIPGGLLVLTMLFMPESPRWLAKKGHYEKAMKNLCWARNLDSAHPYIQMEMSDIRSQLEREESINSTGKFLRDTWKEISSPGIRNRFILAMSLKAMQNLTGLQSINYYSPVIFKSIGFTGTSNSLLATGVFGLVKGFATIFYLFGLVDSWGRRPALIWGSAGSVVAMFYLGAFTKVTNSFNATTSSQSAGSYVALVMVYAFAVCFAFSWNGVPWVFASEVFPTRIRTVGMLFSMMTTWLVQFAIVYSTPYMISGIKYGMFFFFGSCIVISGLVVWAFVPETKGFTLEDMDYLFNSSIWASRARKEAEILRDGDHSIQALEMGRKGGDQEVEVVEAE